MPDIFISYSRKDKAFVQRLHAALSSLNRDIWVDWEDIPVTAKWWEEICAGIDSANAFLFIISPDSIQSEVCQREIQQALQGNKRFIPVLYRELNQSEKVLPEVISEHNWLLFRETDDFEASLNLLNQTLDTDLDHVHNHTQYLVQAREWQNKNQNDSFLLVGKKLQEAENWMANAIQKTPRLTDLHTRYILRSRQLESRRQQTRLLFVTGALLITFVLAVIATLGFRSAEEQRQIARSEANNRATAQAVAERSALVSYSLALATSAQIESTVFNNELALALALVATTLDNPPVPSQQILSTIAFAPGTVRVFTGHMGEGVAAVAITPDGQTAVSAGRDGTIRVWDIATGAELRILEGHEEWVISVSVSPDGKTLLSSSRDNTIRLWDIQTGEELRRYEGEHRDWVREVEFSPDGSTFLSASRDATVILWDVTTGTAIRRFGDSDNPTPETGHIGEVRTVAFSPDGKTFLSGSIADGIILLWDIETGEILRRYTGSDFGILSLMFSPDGITFLAGDGDYQVTLWDVESAELLQTFEGHSLTVKSVAFSPDGRYGLSASDDNFVILWNLATGRAVRRFVGHTDFLGNAVFLPDGRYALSGAADNMLRLWELVNGAELRSYTGTETPLTAVDVTNDGTKAIASSDDSLILWDIQTGEALRQYEGHDDQILDVAFSPDETQFVSASADMNLILWDVATGAEIRRFQGHLSTIPTVDFSPDGSMIASGATPDDNNVILWNVETGEILKTLSGHTASVEGLAFSPDGKTLVSVSEEAPIILWDVETGEIIRQYEGHTGPVLDVDFSPDGNTFVTSSTDTTIILWDVSTGQSLKTFDDPTSTVNSTVFSPDGRHLLSVLTDGTLRLWDIETGRELRHIAPGVSMAAVEFLPDGMTAITGANDGVLRLWDVTPLTLEDVVSWTRSHRYVPELTCVQRERYRIEPPCTDEG